MIYLRKRKNGGGDAMQNEVDGYTTFKIPQ